MLDNDARLLRDLHSLWRDVIRRAQTEERWTESARLLSATVMLAFLQARSYAFDTDAADQARLQVIQLLANVVFDPLATENDMAGLADRVLGLDISQGSFHRTKEDHKQF